MTPWKTLRRRTVFAAAPYLEVAIEAVALPDGRVIEDYYQVAMRPFALIVPVMEDGRVLALRQYKHGPRRVSLTFPAGYLEPAEAPQTAAARELLEETGCDAVGWTALGAFTDHGNQGVATGHYFLARGCRRVQAPDAGDLEEMAQVYLAPDSLDRALGEGGFAIAHQALGWSLARMSIVG